MKNVLVLLHDDDGQVARLQAALDLVRATDGHLTCLDVAALPAIAADPYSSDATVMLLADERARESRNLAEVTRRLEREDIAFDVKEVTGDFAPAIEAAAALADVIVVNRAFDTFARSDLSALAADLIVKSGKPVLAVPQDCPALRAGGKALVAWDGSPSCVAALQAAAPLLKVAESVILLQVDEAADEASAREAAAYLSRHGAHPLLRFERARGRRIEEILLTEIKDRGSDYVVMGGFGHGRLREALFGGVTRQLLRESPVPLFIVHR